MAVIAIQPSFATGELSKLAQARLDLEELRKNGLSLSRNWQHRPQGSILMRGGTKFCALEPNVARLIPFRVAGESDDFILALSPGDPAGKLRIYSRTNGLETFATNMLTNGSFDTDLTGWTRTLMVDGWARPEPYLSQGISYSLGTCKITNVYGVAVYPYVQYGSISQTLATTIGHTYTLRFRAKGVRNGTNLWLPKLRWGIAGAYTPWVDLPSDYETHTVVFTATGVSTTVDIQVYVSPGNSIRETATNLGTGYIDDVTLSDNDAVGALNEFETPWLTDAQLASLQFTSEPAKNRMVLVCDGVAPYTITYTAPDTWDLSATVFTNAPASWGPGNYPRTVETFQGRLWLGNTPNDPGRLWGSKSGDPFNFDIGTGLPNEALDLYISTKGAITWMQGNKVLLIGTSIGEHSLRGSNGTIKPGDFDVQDESSFGGAFGVQAVNIGDQALFVTPDRREVRAMNYSQDENGYLATPLSFFADHITEGKVAELAYSPTNGPVVFARLQSSEVIACTYARAVKALAWWRVDTGAVRAIAVSRSSSGGELWVAVQRAAGMCVEWAPLHETQREYLDSHIVQTMPDTGLLIGLEHLEGETVKVLAGGRVLAETEVADGQVQLDAEVLADDPDLVGVPVVVGLSFRASAKTLSPAEHILGRARSARAQLLVNDSAPPLVNGDRAEVLDLEPSEDEDAQTSKKLRSCTIGWGEDGAITIEQDRPFRTEVLGIFTHGAVEKE